MQVIEITVDKQHLKVRAPCELVAGTVGRYGVKVTYDEEWNATPLRLVQFIGCKKIDLEDKGEVIELPHECIINPCYLKFGLIGMDGNGKVRITTYSDKDNSIDVLPRDWRNGTGDEDLLTPTPNIYEENLQRRAELETENAALNDRCDTLQEQADALEQEVAAHEATIAAKQAEIKDLQGQVEAKQQQIAELQQELDVQQPIIDALEEQVADLQAQITAKQAEIETLQQEKATLEQQVAQLNADKVAMQEQHAAEIAELEEEKAAAVATSYENGVKEGQQRENDRFWDNYQDYGNKVICNYCFAGDGWNNITFKPKYDIKPTEGNYLFANSNIAGDLVEILNNLGVVLDISNTAFVIYLFYSTLFSRVGIINVSAAKSLSYLFMNSLKMKTIDKLILSDTYSHTFTNSFVGMTALENIIIEGKIRLNVSFSNSSLLTDESVQSIIDALADLTGTTAQKITFHTDVADKLTDDQVNAILAKNWNIG